MKVGHQQVHLLECKARRDKYLRVTLRLPGCGPGLQASHCGGPHGHHPTATGFAIGNRLLGFRRHLVPLAVHAVLGQVFGFYRLESSGTHVQRDIGAAYAACLQLRQYGLVKMQRRSGRGHCARRFGKYGLIALGVLRCIRVIALLLAFDVGRQGHVAVTLHQGKRVVARVVREYKSEQRPICIRPAAQQGGAQTIGLARSTVQRHRGPDLRLFADPHVRCHLVAAQYTLHEQLQLAAGRLFAKQSRLEHTRVVHHQQVAALQQVGQLTKNAVCRRAVACVQKP